VGALALADSQWRDAAGRQAADRDYFQQFGWKQAAVWAVEEPESSLNTALEARTAHSLSRVAKEHGGRLQIIGTTHSDLMIQYGEAGCFVEKAA
jgi:predicted ATP-dependent endonuclease of OLD family